MTHSAMPLMGARKPTVSHVKHIVGQTITEYLRSIRESIPSLTDMTLDLAEDLYLPPHRRDLEILCNRLSAELFCETPSGEQRRQWAKLSDLYAFYLSNASA
jgi:hypothetical protein